MAGNYSDVPAPRMAYDSDGTTIWFWRSDNASLSELSSGNLQTLNNEGNNIVSFSNGANYSSYWLGWFFPEQRNITAYWIRVSSSDGAGSMRAFRPGAIYTSADTTNGIDGTWTNQGNWAYDRRSTAVSPAYRTNIDSVSVSNVKAVRLHWSQDDWYDSFYWANVHWYGNVAAGEAPDRLRAWHPTLDEPLDDNTSADGAWLDFGDAARGTSMDKSFRIKNNSSTLTANSVSITNSALTDATPSVPPQFTFSDGGSFNTSLNIGDLGPGAISSVITIRRTTPSNAALSLWTTKVTCDPASWT